MKKLFTIFAITLSFSSLFAAEDEISGNGKNAWDFQNNPFRINENFESKMDQLPLSGDIGKEGFAWPGYYWANNRGGIAYRWRAKNPQNFKYESPSQLAIYSLSSDEINKLSPAEKYDIYTGNYNYPTVAKSWSQTSKREPMWHGICHGVAPSSLHHKEPQTVNLINKDGISITFYSSDVKALLAYYYAKEYDGSSTQIGSRCFMNSKVPFARSSKGCSDVNAGALHIVLTNMIGKNKTGFVADMERFKQVWNHAANSYESKIIQTVSGQESTSVSGTVKRYKMKTKIVYSASIDPTESPVIMTKLAQYESRTYTYWLDVNTKEEIIGGSWVSSERPDFLWVKPKAVFTGKWAALNEIYSPKL